MTLSTVEFYANLLLVSALGLPLFYLVRSLAFRRALLTSIGIYLVALYAPHLTLFWIPYWIVIWIFNGLMGRSRNESIQAGLLAMAVLTALGPMVLWKLLENLFLQMLNSALRAWFDAAFSAIAEPSLSSNLIVPLGLSFSTFRAIDFLVCRHLEVIPRQPLGRVLFLGLFPPILLLGPIAQPSETLMKLDGTDVAPEPDLGSNLAYGGGRILVGLLKIHVLTLPFAGSDSIIAAYSSHSVWWVWVNVFLHAWYFYLNFSGFSDLAIGTSRLYGYKINENFAYPYFRRNLQTFWASWHMSLTGFAQRNVFIPLGGLRADRQYLATFVTMMVIALWHDLTLEMIVFGIAHATVLIALRVLKSQRPSLQPTIPLLPSVLLTHTFVALTIPLLTTAQIDNLAFYRFVLSFGLVK